MKQATDLNSDPSYTQEKGQAPLPLGESPWNRQPLESRGPPTLPKPAPSWPDLHSQAPLGLHHSTWQPGGPQSTPRTQTHPVSTEQVPLPGCHHLGSDFLQLETAPQATAPPPPRGSCQGCFKAGGMGHA